MSGQDEAPKGLLPGEGNGGGDEDLMLAKVRRWQDRQRRWIAEGDPSVARRLAQIGVLGWMIVVPTLLGMFIGRWIDTRLQSGVFWTAPLLIMGLGLGCWSAWKWMKGA